MTQQHSSVRGVIMALSGAACWGFSATCASYLMSNFEVEVVWLAFARLIIAGPVFLALALTTDRQRLRNLLHSSRMLVQVVLFSLVGVVAMQITYMNAVKYAGAGIALLLMETGLIVIMLVTCLRKRRLPTQREAIALVLALVGTACIATQGSTNGLGISTLALVWGLLSGLAMAGHNVIPTTLLAKHGSIVVNGVSMSLAAVMLIPVAHPVSSFPTLPWNGWLTFAAIVAVGTVAAYFLYLQGIKEAGPVKASLVAVFEPVVGLFLSAVWLGTSISLFDLLGCAAILTMMVLIAKAD